MILLVVLYALLILVSSGQDITNVYEEPFAADVRVFGCKSPEYVTINSGQGIIHCTFPPSFKAVFWYDDALTTNTDLPVLRYDSMSGRKSGEGYIKGEYDVTTHGSLVIKKVTIEHEKSFKVICIEENDDVKVYTSSVVVLVESPASQSFIGTCSGPVCYQQSTETIQLKCFFNGTKPARHLLWQPKLAYSHIPSVQTEIVENANGTFNSIATLELTPSKNNLLSIWVCKTYWIHPDDTRKIEIVVDFSDYDSFKSIYSETNLTTEIDKPQALQCGNSYQLYLWKKVKNGTATFLGLHAFGSEIKNNDISFTSNGGIVFSSVKVTHEGLYICMYLEGTTIQMKRAYLEVLVPPTPPSVIIKGCERNVVYTVTTTSATLECSVFGVRPLVDLTWSFDEKLPITLENHKETVSSHHGIFDITSKVDYLITRTTFCDEELVLRCLVTGPASKYFRSVEYVNINLATTCVDRTASSCEDEGKGTMLTTAVVLLTSTIVIETSMLVTLGVWKLCKGY